MNKINKICIECGNSFEIPKYKEDTAIFCSIECYHANKSKTKIIKICDICGQEFKVSPSRKDTANFCSKECHHIFKIKDKIDKTCIVCGNEFSVRKSRGESLYCSVKCRGIGMRDTNSPHYKEKIKRICGTCGEEFYVYPSTLKKGGGKFCSNECYYKFESISKCGENNPMFGKSGGNLGKSMSEETKQKISLSRIGKKHTMETCEKISNATKGEKNPFFGKHHIEGFGVGEKNPRYGILHSEISKQKMSISHYGQMREDKNPNWNGGITPLRKAIRECSEMQEWRRKVFERDNFTCCETGIKGGWLEAHHIIRFEDLLQQYNIQTLDEARNCKELWDVGNGVTMSKDVHRRYHALDTK